MKVEEVNQENNEMGFYSPTLSSKLIWDQPIFLCPLSLPPPRSRTFSSRPNDQANTLQKFLLFKCFKMAKRNPLLKACYSIPLNGHCGFSSAFSSCLHARHTLGWHRVSQLNPATSLHLRSQQQHEKSSARNSDRDLFKQLY